MQHAVYITPHVVRRILCHCRLCLRPRCREKNNFKYGNVTSFAWTVRIIALENAIKHAMVSFARAHFTTVAKDSNVMTDENNSFDVWSLQGLEHLWSYRFGFQFGSQKKNPKVLVSVKFYEKKNTFRFDYL